MGEYPRPIVGNLGDRRAVQRPAMRTLSLSILFLATTVVAQDDAMLAGFTALRKADHRAAEEAFSKAVDRAPDDARTWYYRGVSRLGAGDAEGALLDLDRTLTIAPDDAHALLRRAEAHVQLGSVAAARRDLHAVLAFQPNGPAAEEALMALGRHALAEGDLRGAHTHFDALVEIAPHDANALAERGIVRAALGRDTEALDDLEAALDRDPGIAAAHTHTAIVLLRMGRKQEACHALHEAHALGDRSVEEMLLIHCDH